MGKDLELRAAVDSRLEEAGRMLEEARMLLTLRPNPEQRERLFRLLSGVAAICECIKPSIKR